MNSITTKIMTNILSLVLTAVMCLAGTGCGQDEVNFSKEVPPPTITFDLPEEWAPADGPTGGVLHWSSHLVESPDRENNPNLPKHFRSFEKFTLSTFGGEHGSSIPQGSTPKEAAELYHKNRSAGCTSENKCSITPIQKGEIAGIMTYSIEEVNNNADYPLETGEFTTLFFEKDGHMFELGVVASLEGSLPQKTIETVLSTLEIER